MTDWMGIVLLYLIGMVLLIMEFFLPAYGVIGLVGLGVLGFGLYETYRHSPMGGLVALVIVAIVLPVGLLVAIRVWHRTPVGRRISPPNPQMTDADRMPVANLRKLIGTTGRSLTPLRPVGTCLFGGRRVECKAEYGMIDRDVEVKAVRLIDRTVAVRPAASSERPPTDLIG